MHDDQHDLGLSADLAHLLGRTRTIARRDALRWIGGGTLAATAGLLIRSGLATASTAGTSVPGGCVLIPGETAGPYPGDGSNGPNVLTEADIVRRNITSSVGASTTVAEGIPLTVTFVVTDSTTGCAPMEGAAIYAWHCDREGRYSMYSAGVENENYLRGVQVADANGNVTFDSIFAAAYSGRWPHIHFEVYQTVDDAIGGGPPIATSQLAFPREVCEEVYATEGYEASVANLASTSLETDMVFGDDGAVSQLATMSGDIENGLVAELAVGV